MVEDSFIEEIFSIVVVVVVGMTLLRVSSGVCIAVDITEECLHSSHCHLGVSSAKSLHPLNIPDSFQHCKPGLTLGFATVSHTVQCTSPYRFDQ